MIHHIKRFYKNISIRQKLLLLFSVQIIIPLIFMGIMLYKNAHTVIQNKSISYAADVLKMIELRMNDFADDMINVSEDLLYDTTIYEILSEKEQPLEESAAVTYTYNVLRKICLGKKEIQSIALITREGEAYSYDINGGRASIQELIPYTKILNEARKAGGSATWYFDKDESDHIKDIYLTRMIYDIDNLSEKGIIAILINRDTLKSVYSDLSTEFMQDINILSKENKWIMGTQDNWSKFEQSDFILNADKEWDYQLEKKGARLLAYIQSPETNWKIVAEGSLDKLLNEELTRFRYLFVITTVCTILMLSIFSILMAIDIIDPINRLVASIKKVEEENVHQEVIVDREDELGYLSRCFNKMSEEIDILLNQVYKEQLTRKKAELKALQAQINPHFLFNTLESINWMAQLNNVPEIRDMVTSLGSLIEASIGKGNPMVPLSKELKYIDSYLLIMKNRYGERLTYESDIDTSVLTSQVPKLLLQPLIENAIYHGIDKMRKKGTITLTIKKEEETIHIEIMDNGKGMTEEEVKSLNQKFEADHDDYLRGDEQKSIGLANVNGRIKLFFGQAYGLSVESEYEHYTKMRLRIPIND